MPVSKEKPFVMINLADVIRSDLVDEDTEKRKGCGVKSFPSKIVIMQSDKSLTLLDVENFKNT